MKAKLRHYQINKSLRELSSSPLDMPYKKCYGVFFKLFKKKKMLDGNTKLYENVKLSSKGKH